MASKKGLGTTITFGTSQFSAQIMDVSGPTVTRGTFETSHMGTTGAKTFEPEGLTDGGEVTYDIKYDPSASPPTDQPNETITINFGGVQAVSFTGCMTGFSPTAPMEGDMTASVTIKVCDDITGL